MRALIRSRTLIWCSTSPVHYATAVCRPCAASSSPRCTPAADVQLGPPAVVVGVAIHPITCNPLHLARWPSSRAAAGRTSGHVPHTHIYYVYTRMQACDAFTSTPCRQTLPRAAIRKGRDTHSSLRCSSRTARAAGSSAEAEQSDVGTYPLPFERRRCTQ